MPLEKLQARIQMQMHEMRNGDYVRDMVRDARHSIANFAPEDSGQLLRNLTKETPLQETAQGFRMGLGPRSAVGDEKVPAPRGTIVQFLEDYPQFRFGGTGIPKKRSHHKGESNGKGQPDPSVGAWRGLSTNAKAMLKRKREEGLYGGSQQGFATGKSPWFYPQEGSLDGWGESAEAAHIKPTRFLERAMIEWGAEGIARMRKNIMARTGWKRA